MTANSGVVKAGSWQSKGSRSACRLLRLDVQALDHLDQDRPLLVEDLPEVGAVASRLVDAERVDDLLDALGLAAFDHEIGKLLHGLFGRARGRTAADPAAHLEGF